MVQPANQGTVDLQLILEGYDQANARLSTGRQNAKSLQDSTRLYIPLLETLGWADVIEERLEAKVGPDWVLQLPAQFHAHEGYILGFRYARNVVHHNWSTAVELDNAPPLLQDWAWVVGLASTKPQPTNKASYDKVLAGRMLRHTFRPLHQLYNAALATFGNV